MVYTLPSVIPLLSAFLDLLKQYQTPNFSNQFSFPLEVQKIGIPLYSEIFILTPKNVFQENGLLEGTLKLEAILV